MAEDGKVNLKNKIVYGAIAGGVTGAVESILAFLALSINLGKFNEIEWISQQMFGTTAGNPNLVGFVIVDTVILVVIGIIYGITLFLLMTRAGWERDLTRYLIVAIVYSAVGFLLDLTIAITSTPELDLLIDGSILLIIGLILALILALTFYYLEERFESAS